MEIDWFIYCVFDPDGLGQDFAYTDGLWRHGSPELHIWARPPDGPDPGADWSWSDRDMMRLLNDAGLRQLSGELELGDTWTIQVDHGLATVEFNADGRRTRARSRHLSTRRRHSGASREMVARSCLLPPLDVESVAR